MTGDEKAPGGKKRAEIERRIVGAGGPARGALRAAVVLGLAAGVAVIGQAALVARILDGVVFRHRPVLAFGGAIEGLLAVIAARGALAVLAGLAAHHAAASVKTALRSALVARVFALGPAYTARERSAELATTITEGVEALDPYLSGYLPQRTLVVLVPLAMLAAIAPADWRSALVLALSAPLIPVFMVLVGEKAREISERKWRELLAMSARLLDAIQGITTLKLFGRAQEEIGVIGRISEEYRRTTMAGLRVAFLTSAVLEFFASLAIAMVAVLFGARLVQGRVAFLPAFFVLLLVPEFFLPLRTLATHYHARMGALAAAERIFGILDAPPAVVAGGPEMTSAVGPAVGPAMGLGSGAPIEIVCRGLEAGWEPGRPVLRGITCEFAAGRMSAIVGRSGAGKLTLAAAILGFVPASHGEILIGDRGPLGAIDRESWWRNIAYVPQAPRVFAGTIAENLRLARPDADEAALAAAAEQAGLLGVVAGLPAGFDTRVGEGGVGLSGGEVQRLALARAFLKDAPVLVLDEATAHLDLETEAEIAATIARLAAGRTAILIAHRWATVRRAAQILVMEEGEIIERGTHEALFAAGGAYAAMLRSGEARACAT